MLLLIVLAFIAWLAANGRLATYVALATTPRATVEAKGA